MSSLPILVFDLGGLLVDTSDMLSRIRQLVKFLGTDAELKEVWLASPAVTAFETGQINQEEFAKQFLEEWRLNISARAFLDEFASWPGELDPRAPALFDGLRSSFRIACLSNCNPLHWKRFSSFLHLFDSALSSHLLGAAKPSTECFRLACVELRCSPGEVSFFDDSATNVAGARKLGMRAFHVVGFDSLSRAFEGAVWRSV
jgi:HAD superfamily hydrolase (TIGR01509 family)